MNLRSLRKHAVCRRSRRHAAPVGIAGPRRPFRIDLKPPEA